MPLTKKEIKQQLDEAKQTIKMMETIINNYAMLTDLINYEVIQEIENVDTLDEIEKHTATYDFLIESYNKRNLKIANESVKKILTQTPEDLYKI